MDVFIACCCLVMWGAVRVTVLLNTRPCLNATTVQGRVRTKTVKRASRVLIEKYYQKLTMDFDTNKRICDEVAIIQSKRLRNKIAGFTTVRRVRSVACSE